MRAGNKMSKSKEDKKESVIAMIARARKQAKPSVVGNGRKQSVARGSVPEVDPPSAAGSTPARRTSKLRVRFPGTRQPDEPPGTPKHIRIETKKGLKGKQHWKLRKALNREKARRRRNAIQKGLITAKEGLSIPPGYDPLIADHICQRYADGEPMLAILARQGYPNGGRFYMWVETIPQLEKQWAAARKARAHSLAEETLTISDQSLEGHPAFIPAHALRVKTRQWLAAKARPETYGEQLDLHHTGQLSIAALSSQLKTVNPPELIDGKTGKPIKEND